MAERSLVVDIGCTDQFSNYAVDCFPALTANRCSGEGWWIVDLGRQATLRDFFLLQGHAQEVPYAAAKVSPVRMAHMLGNSMSLNVLERLLPRLLALAKIFPSAPRPDAWETLTQRLTAQQRYP